MSMFRDGIESPEAGTTDSWEPPSRFKELKLVFLATEPSAHNSALEKYLFTSYWDHSQAPKHTALSPT